MFKPDNTCDKGYILRIYGKSIVFDDIDSIFELFKNRLSQKSSTQDHLLSELAMIIDVHGLIIILNFFNKYRLDDKSKITSKSDHLIVKSFALVIYEIIKYYNKSKDSNTKDNRAINIPKELESIRHEVHQFMDYSFDKEVEKISAEMGRSKNKNNKMIDICIHYEEMDSIKYFIGTNQFEFINRVERTQSIVDSLQFSLREIEKMISIKTSGDLLIMSDNTPSYKWNPYSYVSILEMNKHLSDKQVVRLLILLDQVSSVYEFFHYVISVDEYLKSKPFIIFFFRKMVSVVIDETLDNLKSMNDFNGKNSSISSDIKNVIGIVDTNKAKACKKLRNNLHYSFQKSFHIGEVDDSYDDLLKLLEINKLIMREISELINCYPSKISLLAYRFLRYIQL